MMRRKSMALLLIILGLILGPGYFVYAKFFSGRTLAEYPLKPEDTGFAALDLKLPAGQSPLRLVLKLDAEHGPTTGLAPKNTYSITLRHGGSTITREISVTTSSIESSQQTFLHEIATLGESPVQALALEIRAVSAPEMRVRNASVELRGGVVEPALPLYGTGIALLALGAGLMIF